MQDLQLFNTNITMSSLEIAELTGKDHDKVMRSIRSTLEQAKIDHATYGDIYLDKYGREQPCYRLPKFETDLVISGYSVPYRAIIIRRWQELEQEKLYGKFKLPKTYKEAVSQLLDTLEEKEILEEQALLNKPKVEAFDNAKAIFPNKDYSEGEKAYKKDIKILYPFLDNGKINNILEFYTTKKYKDSVYYIKDEIEECMKKFFKDCKYRISDSRISVIATHECLLNSKCVISKEYAIEYLNFLEEEFDL